MLGPGLKGSDRPLSTATPPPFEKTRVLAAFSSDGSVNQQAVDSAAQSLQAGWPVVVPSETVYGLAALAKDEKAVERVFLAKGRPSDNPLIVHVSNLAQAIELGAKPSALAHTLADTFWPGPLSLVVQFSGQLAWVTAQLDSIALRQPNHPFFQRLIERVGPLAAPSANISGYPSPTRAQHALQDLAGRIPLIIDGGPVEHGLESTVVDARGNTPVILRPGATLQAELEQAARVTPAEPTRLSQPNLAPRSPGLKYRHYSPRAQVWFYPNELAPPGKQLLADAKQLVAQGRSIALIGPDLSDANGIVPQIQRACPRDAHDLAHHLFDWLRKFDALGVECILVQGPSKEGIGRAIVDRITRAASQIRSSGKNSSLLAEIPLLPSRHTAQDLSSRSRI